jgi:hypothetical protein
MMLDTHIEGARADNAEDVLSLLARHHLPGDGCASISSSPGAGRLMGGRER